MNLLDRVVSYVDPQAGLRRQAARLAQIHVRAYAAATASRSREGWWAPSTSANVEIGTSMVKVRNGANQAVRDHPLARRCVDLWDVQLNGDGYTLDFVDGPKTITKRRRDKWKAWAETTKCDSDGQLDLNGLMSLATRIMVTSGEVLILLEWTNEKGMPVPLRLKVLEPDHLDHTMNGIYADNGNPIHLGIETDKNNPSTRVAYHLHKEHPGEHSALPRTSLAPIRVLAKDVLHLYRKERTQSRGISWFAPILTRLQDFDDYSEALFMKAKVEACPTLIIEQDDAGTQTPIEALTERKTGDVELSPGKTLTLPRGARASSFNPSNSTSHSPLMVSQVRQIAVGIGLTYASAYSDLTGANYSSLRAGDMEFKRAVSKIQWGVFITMGFEPIAEAFIEAGAKVGLWGRDYNVEIQPPKSDFIDPKKDGDAERADIDYGLTTWSDAVRRRGYNPGRQIEALKAERQALREAELDLPFGGQIKRPEITVQPAAKDGEPQEVDE